MVDVASYVVGKPVKYLFRRAGAEVVYNKLVGPYFTKTKARLALTAVAATNATNLGGGVYFTYLMRDIFNNLAAKDFTPFVHNMGKFTLCSLAMVATSGARSYITNRLKLSWGNWAKGQAINELLSPENRHRLVTTNAKLEPEQRIGNDISSFVHLSEPLAVGFLQTVGSFGAYSCMLYDLSPALFAGTLAYGATSIWLKRQSGKGLVGLDNETTSINNQFRNDIRDSNAQGKSIALYKGTEAVRAGLDKSLESIKNVGKRGIRKNLNLEVIRSSIDYLSFVYPYAFIAGNYFSAGSTADIGGAIQSMNAFHQVRGALDWYGNNQYNIIGWKAAVQRLTSYLSDCEQRPDVAGNFPAYAQSSDLGLKVKNLLLQNPAGEILSENVSFTLKAGDRLVLTGASGCGKTTLFETVAGVLPHHHGSINYTGTSERAGDVIFVPQHKYVPDLPFREILSFPKIGTVFPDAEIQQVLEKVGLGGKVCLAQDGDKAGIVSNWSGGEHQRLNFARLLLHKPSIIGLDEATSALPPSDAAGLYKLLITELPKSIIVSISHQMFLKPLHNLEGTLCKGTFTLNSYDAGDHNNSSSQTPAPHLPVQNYGRGIGYLPVPHHTKCTL